MLRAVPGPGWRAHLSPFDWGALLSASAVVEAALLLLLGLVLTDLETLTFGVVVAATTALLFVRRNRLALLVRFAVFADVEFWMGAAALTNLLGRGGPGAVIPPLALAVTSAVGLVATVVSLSARRREQTGRPAQLAAGATAVFVLAALLALLLGHPSTARGPAAAAITIKNAKYSSTSLTATRDTVGKIRITVTNDDLFWHTFTSPALHVDERFPLKAGRTIVVPAKPGVYAFYCAIPGHAQIGMKGMVTVK